MLRLLFLVPRFWMVFCWSLGGFELLRIFPVLFKFGFVFGVVWIALSLVGGFLVTLFCIRQTDIVADCLSSVAWTGFIWLRFRASGGMSCTGQRTVTFRKIRTISWLVQYVSDFQEVFSFTGLLSSKDNPLKTKRNPLYIRNQFVPRSKHFPPRL